MRSQTRCISASRPQPTPAIRSAPSSASPPTSNWYAWRFASGSSPRRMWAKASTHAPRSQRNPEIIRVKVIVLSTRKFEARFQSAAVAIGERERAAKRADELLGDGKAKPGAAGFAIARSLDPIKRQEDRLQMLVGNTGAAVRHGDRDAVRPLRIDGDFDILAEFQPVIDQVDQDAAQGLRVREY